MSTPTTSPLTVAGTVHFVRRGRTKELRPGPAPTSPEPGRVPRVARLMALALRFDGLIRTGAVTDQAELARLGHVTRARVSQIMALLNLAPDIQEALLFLPQGRQRPRPAHPGRPAPHCPGARLAAPAEEVAGPPGAAREGGVKGGNIGKFSAVLPVSLCALMELCT